MKISEMLEREDFYTTLERTLTKYFGFDITVAPNNVKQEFAFVYKHINAIVSRFPDKKVKWFLYTEYKTKNLFKRIIAQAYLRFLLNTGGLFADRKLKKSGGSKLGDNYLIYPCNKKIRIFNFKENFVDVIVKDGFSNNLIEKEIEFREKHHSNHLLPILSKTANSYREEIINGIPLARIRDKKKYNEHLKQTVRILKNEISDCEKQVDARRYVEQMKNNFFQKTESHGLELLKDSFNQLSGIALVGGTQTIPVVLSHGDLQPGNIWIENITGKVIFIDFETYNERSTFYDLYTLFHNLRSFDFHKKMIKLLKGEESEVLGKDNLEGILAIVLMEDFLFKLDEALFFNNDNQWKEIMSFNEKVNMVISEMNIHVR